ncbi:MAG: class II histone deacetylase [Pseudomonadota bacterium]
MFHKETISSRRTGIVSSELFYWHDTLNWCGFFEPTLELQPGEHFENPETKRRLQNLLQATGLWENLTVLQAEPADNEVISLVHPIEQVNHLQTICSNGGGDAGAQTPVGPASFEVARLAVGGVVAAVDAVVANDVDNAYVLCRPPGHHALPDLAMGFCLFANGSIGVKHAQRKHGIEKIAVIDWDVHHGNGTETIFLDDPSVLTVSVHQDNLFPPDSGSVEVKGAGGSNLNVPLPPGSGSGAYREAFERVVIPALDAFQPDMLFIASGYDASALDPLGVQMLSSEDFRWMTKLMLEVADRHCGGKIVTTHEGGYSATYVPYCGLAMLEELCGASATLPDPFYEYIRNYGGHGLSLDQQSAINRAYEANFST